MAIVKYLCRIISEQDDRRSAKASRVNQSKSERPGSRLLSSRRNGGVECGRDLQIDGRPIYLAKISEILTKDIPPLLKWRAYSRSWFFGAEGPGLRISSGISDAVTITASANSVKLLASTTTLTKRPIL